MKLWRESDGAQLVEFGLVLLPAMAFFFLIFDIAWFVFAQVSLQFAVREGTRYAVTSQTLGGLGQDASIKSVVQGKAFGFLAGDTGLSKITIEYYSPVTLARVSPSTPHSNAGGNIVEVSITGVSMAPLLPLLRDASPLLLSVRSSDVMESSPGGTPPLR